MNTDNVMPVHKSCMLLMFHILMFHILIFHILMFHIFLQVSVHAHDRNSTVSNIVGEQEGVQDQLDTWHGEKEVIKAMKKITCGANKWSGIK